MRFIRRFESYAVSLEWPMDRWAINLSALLHGVALDVYNRQPVNETSNYESLKEALLRRFMLTEEGFREKLRTAKPERGESFGQFMTRLKGYFNRWIELGHVDKTYLGLKDALLREQAMSVVTRNLRIFIMERKPKDIGEMNILTEQYLEVHGNTYNFANVDKHRQNLVVGQQQSKSPDRSSVCLVRRTSRKEENPSVVKVDNKSTYHRDTRRCYLCNKVGHIARECRVVKKPSLAPQSIVKAMHASVKSNHCMTLAHERVGDDQRVTIDNGSRGVQTRTLSTDMTVMPVVEGRICGRTGSVSVLRDTGCSGGIVRSMCSEDSFTGETRTCVMINGDTFTAPVVHIMVDTLYFTGQFNALAVEKPMYDIVVGNIPGTRDANDPDRNWRSNVELKEKVGKTEEGKMLHEKDGNTAEEETQLEKVTPDSEAGYTEVTQIRSEGDGFKVKLNMCADIAESAQGGHMTKDEEYVSEQEAEHHTTDDDDERLEEQERSKMEQERSEMEQERSEMEQERSEMEQERSGMEQERSEMEQERSEMEQERSGMERGRAIEEKEFHKEVERQRRLYLEQPALESETRFERRSTDDIKTEVTYHNTGLKTDYNTGLLKDHNTGQAGMPHLHDPLDMRSSKVPKDRPRISSRRDQALERSSFERNRRIDGKRRSPLSKSRRYTSWERKKAGGRDFEKTVDTHGRRARCPTARCHMELLQGVRM